LRLSLNKSVIHVHHGSNSILFLLTGIISRACGLQVFCARLLSHHVIPAALGGGPALPHHVIPAALGGNPVETNVGETPRRAHVCIL